MIDAHTHVFFGNMALEAVFAKWELKSVVINITGKGIFSSSMDDRWQAMLELKSSQPQRFILCTTFDAREIESPAFASTTIAMLRRHIDQGAELVKVWKDVGLDVRDGRGSLVQIDDERFKPIWQYLADEGVPVIAHIAEPRAAWQPLDRSSPHYRFYSTHPEQHLHGRTDVPSWNQLIEARDRWVAANPALTVIGAHLGSMAHDVEEVSRRLDAYPNFYVDTAERFGDLLNQNYDVVRRFFLRYHDRVLYGSDVIIDDPANIAAAAYDDLLRTQTAFFSEGAARHHSDTDSAIRRAVGLNLPREIRENILGLNASRCLQGAAKSRT